MKAQLLLPALVAGAALTFVTAAYPAERALKSGKVEKADQFIGRNIVNQQGDNIGKIEDLVVDLESGRILYALIGTGGLLGVGENVSAVPTRALNAAEGKNHLILDVDKDKLKNAPQFNRERARNLGDASFIREVYSYYNQPASFDASGRFGNVHRVSDVLKMEVQNVSDEQIAKVHDLALDLSGHRLLYVILNPTRALDDSGSLYAVPPMVLTAGDKGTLVANLDKNKIESAPKFKEANWQEITTPSYAANVYRFYGKRFYTDGGEAISPTGRDDDDDDKKLKSRIEDETKADRQRDREQRREDRELRRNRAERREGRLNRTAQADLARDYGPITDAKALIGWDLRSRQDEKIGTLKDIVVDLESGRILYGVVDVAGIGAGARDNRAIAPAAFGRADRGDKAIHVDFGKQKLEQAPTVPAGRDAQIAEVKFVEDVYRYYDLQPWFSGAGAPTGRFGNVHRASDLIGMKVENVNGQDFGKVQNLAVDLADGRIAFALLNTRGGGRGGGDLVAVPPMALTLSSDRQTLTTNLDGDQLASAPKVDANNLQKLDDASFAAEVYRYHGKDMWWQAGATGRE